MAAVLALLFLAPILAGLAGIGIYAVCLAKEAAESWRDRRSGPYVPSRVWFDERYGGTDGDPRRYQSPSEFPHQPTPFDPGPPAPLHATRPRR